MWGLFCLSVLVDVMKIKHGSFFCSSVFVSVCVFNVWPKTTLLPVWPRDTKRLATPASEVEERVKKDVYKMQSL